MEENQQRGPLLVAMYEHYLATRQAPDYLRQVMTRYSVPTLERLARHGERMARRAAVLALGMLGDYESNHVIGSALSDPDRGVRTLAENAIRAVWHRAGNQIQRDQLQQVLRLLADNQYLDAVRKATELIEHAPWFAEVWNQRAIAFHQLGRFAESIRDCHQALEINPYHFAAAAGMGQCYLKLNDPNSALECFRRALRLNPNLEGIRSQVVYLQRSLKED